MPSVQIVAHRSGIVLLNNFDYNLSRPFPYAPLRFYTLCGCAPAVLVIRNFLLYCAHGVILYHTLFKLEMQRLTDTRRLNSFHNFTIPYQNKCRRIYANRIYAHTPHVFYYFTLLKILFQRQFSQNFPGSQIGHFAQASHVCFFALHACRRLYSVGSSP